MKKLITLIIALFLSASALASTTWSAPAPATGYVGRVAISQAVCTTGSESAPSGVGTTSAPVGLSLTDTGSFTVFMDTSGNTSAGTLYAYLYNPATGTWARAPDLDLTVPANVTSYAWPGFKVEGPVGRIAYVPNGLGSITVTIYTNASAFRR